MDKIRLATAWLGGCSGCHMSFLDLDERLIDLHGRAEVVFSPVMDVKRYPEHVDVALVEGAVANSDNRELLETIRARTRILIAFGDCAVNGNVTAMRNGIDRDEMLKQIYGDIGRELGRSIYTPLPILEETVMPINKVVTVDAFLPGCPPHADLIWHVITELLEGRIPILTEEQLKYG
jgi:NAD-reducing hydrogenase small subunit